MGMGYFIPGENEGTSLSERVRDIATNPGMYYFNFHSIASWAYWSAQNPSNPQPVGMCRGVMAQSNVNSLSVALELSLASTEPSPDYWLPLGGSMHNVADDEGELVGKLVGSSLEECEMSCDKHPDCRSLALCGDACYLKAKDLAANAPRHYNKYCTSFRKDTGTDDMCFSLFSSMAYNNLLQSFPNNPDSQAQGFATFKLCTNGTLITDTALVYGGQSPLIASRIHRAQNGDGENGSGPPVISFCGSNTRGLINAAGPYPEPCAPYMGGSSNNAHMMGYFIPGENEGTSLSQRVLDIAANPGKYYFNFHSIASWAYWSAQNPSNPQPVGMCRGVMHLSDMPMEQSNTISLGAALDLNMASAKPKDAGTDDMCVNLFTSMAYNNLLQSFPNNPDSRAEGMATFKLCTNGTLIADTALVYGGQTPL